MHDSYRHLTIYLVNPANASRSDFSDELSTSDRKNPSGLDKSALGVSYSNTFPSLRTRILS